MNPLPIPSSRPGRMVQAQTAGYALYDEMAPQTSGGGVGGVGNSAGGLEEMSVQITNMVCNFRLPMHIDLRKLAYAWSNVIMMTNYLEKKLRSPACTAKIFNNGKIVIMGCTSEEDCMAVSRGISRSIQRVHGRINESLKMRNYRISNMLANTKVPFKVNLTKLATEHKRECTYEQEISSSADFKFTDLHVTIRVFHTGAIVMLGATSRERISEALTRVWPYLDDAKAIVVREFNRSSTTTVSANSGNRRVTTTTTTATRKRRLEVRGSRQEEDERFNGNFSDEEDLWSSEGNF